MELERLELLAQIRHDGCLVVWNVEGINGVSQERNQRKAGSMGEWVEVGQQ
jgi:hypothetical protein